MNIQSKLEKILPLVEKPGRYVGGEINQIVKKPESLIADIALAFPDAYELGMSNNGMNILYQIINREPRLAAERSYAPMPDMAKQMKENHLPLYSLETHRPLGQFKAVGISIQTELNFTNIPYVLELGGINAFSHSREELEPFIIGGGPCMANPEPVADFFDLFVIGDGEKLTLKVLYILGEGRAVGKSRKEILAELNQLKGIYIPALHPFKKNSYGNYVPDKEHSKGAYHKSQGIQRFWVEDLNPADFPTENPVPNTDVVHNRFAVEVMRGCTQGCRFCQAGYWYRPTREINSSDVVKLAKKGLAATGQRELGLLSLSSADYSHIEHLTDNLVADKDFQDINVSLPSLRANSFGQGLAAKISELGGGKSATFAPETGSERLRKIINKNISDAEMVEAAEGVFKNGFKNIKLYTMVGLPTENLEDMDAFCGLIEKLNRVALKFKKSNTIHANIGIFIPKPSTPMQWSGFMEHEKVKEHIMYVRKRFKYIKSVRITWADWGLAALENYYSRGDRSLSTDIYAAYQKGKIFESFGEFFDFHYWDNYWRESGHPMKSFTRERDQTEIFPWDIIHPGVAKNYLWAEYRKMFNTTATPIPDCKWGECNHCGIPGNYQDIKLAGDETLAVPVRLPDREKIKSEAPESGEGPGQSYTLIFAKKGLSKFLPHHTVLEAVERAFYRLGFKFKMTRGFHKRPIIKNAGALPLGLESNCEILIIELIKKLGNNLMDISRKLSSLLPGGIDILSIREKSTAKMPQIKSIRYKLMRPGEYAECINSHSRKNMHSIVNKKGKSIDLNSEIMDVNYTENELVMNLKANKCGTTLNPFLIYSGFTGLAEGEIRKWPILKESQDFLL